MRRYGLRDDRWDRIQELLPGRPGTAGVTASDNRLFVEALLYRYRAGIPWRDLPERFGDWKNVHRRFSRWAESGVWEKVFQHLAADADSEYAMIDSTIVRAHQHSAGAGADQAIGRSRGGLSTKIHILVISDVPPPLGIFGELGWLLRHQVPRHRFVDAFFRPAVHEACQQLGEIGLWIDAVEFARLNQRRQECPVLATFVAAGE
jgi:transposase